MIKAKNLIKKVDRYITYRSTSDKLSQACFTAAYTLIEPKIDQILYFSSSLIDREIVNKHKARIERLAARFEREFLRVNKKPKFIILHGLDIKEMEILTWNTGCDVPYYENAVFASKEEAKRFAELEEMDDFTIVEVLNEN